MYTYTLPTLTIVLILCRFICSHCVNFTFLDILKYWHSDNAKLHLLQDGCSSVQGYEEVGRRFLVDIERQGVTVVNCGDVKLT